MYSITDENFESFSKERILSLITEEDIFKLVFKEIPTTSVTSPFRDDENPDCYFERDSSGKLYFIDFGNSTKVKNISMSHLDCFSAVQLYYDIPSFPKTLEFIYKKCIEGQDIKTLSLKRPVSTFVKKKENKKIFIKSRNFNSQDAVYWTKFSITRKNLMEDLVIPVIKVSIVSSYDKTYSFEPSSVCYAYTEFEEDRKKLYFPYSSRRRFISSCNKNDIGSVKHISTENNQLIIAKSYKDCRILRNLNLNSIWFQNEGMFPDNKILSSILSPFNQIIIFFDNDTAGYTASENLSIKIKELTSSKEVRKVFLPIDNKKIKDPGEFVQKVGINALNQFIDHAIRHS